MIPLVCYVVAVICFILAAFGVDGRLTPVGLAFFAAGHAFALGVA